MLIYFSIICIVCLFHILPSVNLTGVHECEVLGGGPEAEESASRWRECKKNPGHKEFISAKGFKDSYFSRVHTDKLRDLLRAMIDFTVRLRVHWTSPGRPDEDPFSDARGTDKIRLGTGFIEDVSDPVSDKPCPCVECNGKINRKSWRFKVQTAAHVVYNTEEAKSTRIDLFYDDDSSRRDGTMATVTGLELVGIDPDSDVCGMMCVTHDEALGERIESVWRCWLNGYRGPQDLSGLDFLLQEGRDPTLIVSHPHGQPKKITVGQWRYGEFPLVEYNAATCPGSSGAPVFRFYPARDDRRYDLLSPPVHSGKITSTSTQHRDQLNIQTRFSYKLRGRETKLDQLNYGNWW